MGRTRPPLPPPCLERVGVASLTSGAYGPGRGLVHLHLFGADGAEGGGTEGKGSGQGRGGAGSVVGGDKVVAVSVGVEFGADVDRFVGGNGGGRGWREGGCGEGGFVVGIIVVVFLSVWCVGIVGGVGVLVLCVAAPPAAEGEVWQTGMLQSNAGGAHSGSVQNSIETQVYRSLRRAPDPGEVGMAGEVRYGKRRGIQGGGAHVSLFFAMGFLRRPETGGVSGIFQHGLGGVEAGARGAEQRVCGKAGGEGGMVGEVVGVALQPGGPRHMFAGNVGTRRGTMESGGGGGGGPGQT
mmetsp:Transcript_28173/g.64452  ORF Transcript_28173/g.64452 Transcript_28173/m.64452 type:complete len:295 (+) Transcript_28173:392-1276(+)